MTTRTVWWTLLILIAGASPAWAYIDPNVGGILFQWLAVGFATVSGLVLFFARQIRSTAAQIRRAARRLTGLQADR